MTTENLSGRSAIVTGGGSGIGQAIALELTAASVASFKPRSRSSAALIFWSTTPGSPR
jgi:NAD(P)-dependent dehydrogenase (short-subunit alcohol dehydrogenase family)